jgi:phosphatidylinositol-3-phosphatase
MKLLVCRVALLALLIPLPAWAQTLPPVKTVFVLMLENYGWPSIKGSTNAPYINNVLLPQASYCEQYYTPSNFTASLLSYLWLEAGSTFGLTSTDTNCYSPPAIWSVNETNHLSTLLNNAGISWRSYQECIAGDVVPLTDWWCYAVRHNGFVYFHDVTGTNDPHYAYGIVHNRPYSEFWADLTNNVVARYNFITPGVCSDMHNSCDPLNNPILQGDTWLSAEVPKILDSAAYRDNGALFIIWDDGGKGGIPSGMILLSPLAKGGGYASTNRYTHSDTLRTFQDIFGVQPYLGGAADARNLAELFAQPQPQGLRIAGVEKLGPGYYRFVASGAASNATLVLQCSTNLVGWESLLTNPPGQNTFDVNLPTNNPADGGFFRLHDPGN